MKKKTVYALLKELEENKYLSILLRNGIVPISILNKKTVYETFILNTDSFKKTESVKITSSIHEVSEDFVWRSIRKMNTCC